MASSTSTLSLFIFISCFHLILFEGSFSSKPSLCHDDERSALSQIFDRTFSIDIDASDCCTWEGVYCDDHTGHVTILQLNDLSLNASINSTIITTVLRKLTDLNELSLSWLKFESSALSGLLANLSSLSHLELNDCGLYGEFPTSIFQLPSLHVLIMSLNPYSTGYLPEFNKTSPLEQLILIDPSFSGKLPDSIGYLNSLKEFDISGCNFSGSIPASFGNLTQLTRLDLSSNNFSGSIPASFGNLIQLTSLDLSSNNFSGSIPASFGNLIQLISLDLSSNNFSGSIPATLGNLTQLMSLDLSFNNFNRGTLAWLGKQTNLTSLLLSETNLIGDIPPSLGNLTQLVFLRLNTNQLSGQIPSRLANLTQLVDLELDSNELQGPIPPSIFELPRLNVFHLNHNHLSGTVESDLFFKRKSLVSLQLSYNNLSIFLTKTNVNATVHMFELLGLATCNISEFPDFLRHQDELSFLELSGNRIQGQIPKWVWNIGKETLIYMSVSYNLLTSFGQPPVVFSWTRLQILNLQSNMFQGSLLIPPPSTMYYLVSNNSLTGKISPQICNLTSLEALDLSNNNLSGILPNCLGHFSDSLLILNLRNNNFHGTIPRIYASGSKLRMIDLSQNRLQGSVPRSLANCKMLELLNLGNNKINDIFPSWLGTFRKLRALILRSNEFHGPIRSPESKFEFPMLRIIDISYNNFTGKLPFEYFQNWNAMNVVNAENFIYMQMRMRVATGFQRYRLWDENYKYSMTITNKGLERIYGSIPEIFAAIDLSSNRFEGDIPKFIGNLKELRSLNLSNNALIGCIPQCLESLTVLESLDLSQNNLSGEIPQELTGLTFLEFLNVSHNHLMGPIPQGKQFDTFQNNSFEGNPRLCGKPLSKKCKNSPISPPPPLIFEHDRNSRFPSGYDWIFILAGSVSGLIVGLVVGHSLTTRKHEWFVETFGRRPQKRQREKKKGQRNVI